MRSIADTFRFERAREEAAMSASERVALALELGDQDLEIFRLAHGLSANEALRELRRRRQAGRVPCSFFEAEP
jgi:hypothetical protein